MIKNKLIKFSATSGLLALALSVSVPFASAATLTFDATSVVSDGVLTLNGAAGSALNIGTASTTGVITIGSVNTGGIAIGVGTAAKTITIGSTSTGAETITIGNAAAASGTNSLNGYNVAVAQAATTGTLTVGAAAATGAVAYNGAVTGGANTLFANATTSNIAIGNVLTTGTITIGGNMVWTPATHPDRDALELGADGNNATIRVFAEDLSAFAIKGIDFTDGSTVVNSYSGIFGDASYSDIGTDDTRFITGGNPGMDVQLQSADALLLVAQDGASGNGVVKVMSQNGIEFHAQYDAEQLSPKRLIVSRVSTASTGVANTSDVTLGTNDGKLYLQQGTVLGGVVFPNMTTTERDAITCVAGEVVFNTTTSKLTVCTGSDVWVEVH